MAQIWNTAKASISTGIEQFILEMEIESLMIIPNFKRKELT